MTTLTASGAAKAALTDLLGGKATAHIAARSPTCTASNPGGFSAGCQTESISFLRGAVCGALCLVGAVQCSVDAAVAGACRHLLVSLCELGISHILSLLCFASGQIRLAFRLIHTALFRTGQMLGTAHSTACQTARALHGCPGSTHGPASDHTADAAFLLDSGHAGVARQNAGDDAAGLKYSPCAAQDHQKLCHAVQDGIAYACSGKEHQITADDDGNDDEIQPHGYDHAKTREELNDKSLRPALPLAAVVHRHT